jgi:hypothetical protein
VLRFTWRTFAAGSEIAMSSVMVTVPSRLYPGGGQPCHRAQRVDPSSPDPGGPVSVGRRTAGTVRVGRLGRGVSCGSTAAWSRSTPWSPGDDADALMIGDSGTHAIRAYANGRAELAAVAPPPDKADDEPSDDEDDGRWRPVGRRDSTRRRALPDPTSGRPTPTVTKA